MTLTAPTTQPPTYSPPHPQPPLTPPPHAALDHRCWPSNTQQPYGLSRVGPRTVIKGEKGVGVGHRLHPSPQYNHEMFNFKLDRCSFLHFDLLFFLGKMPLQIWMPRKDVVRTECSQCPQAGWLFVMMSGPSFGEYTEVAPNKQSHSHTHAHTIFNSAPFYKPLSSQSRNVTEN